MRENMKEINKTAWPNANASCFNYYDFLKTITRTILQKKKNNKFTTQIKITAVCIYIYVYS